MEKGILASLCLCVLPAVCLLAWNNSYSSGGHFMNIFWISFRIYV